MNKRHPRAPAADTVLSFARVAKRYRRRAPVLVDVNLDLPRGQFVQMHGDNGSGKSTLLRLAAGFTRPTSGRVDRSAAATRFVPDQTGMLDTLTANAYLAHLARISGHGTRHARSRIEELQHLFAVKPGLNEPLSALSKGNRQKVLLMQVFLTPADLILMDEPTTALDAAAVSELRNLVQIALRDGAGVLVATHGSEFTGLGRSYAVRGGQVTEVVSPERASAGGDSRFPSMLVRLLGANESLNQAGIILGEPILAGADADAGAEREFRVARSSLSEFLVAALNAGCEVLSVAESETP